MTERIVVGYTATKAGRDAVAFAARLARATSARLDLAIVLPAEGRSVITPPDAGYDRYLRTQAEEWLTDAAAKLPAGVAHEPHVRYAESFAEGLIDLADETGASYIVVGAASGGLRGHHRIGSTTNELLHSSDVPVVLVPRGSRKMDAKVGITRLTAAVGTRPGAQALLDEAAALSAEVAAPLRLLSLVTVDLPATVDTGAIRVAEAAHAEEVLAAAQASLPAGGAADVVAARGAGIEEAVTHLEWEPGEVVLVGSSRLAQPRRLFLGSTAAKMLNEVTVPVIVVPRTRGAQDEAGR